MTTPPSDEKDAALVALATALAMYADPGSYHAISFWPDPPCGDFYHDFSEDHGDPFYDRAMPGALARKTLDEHSDLLLPLLPDDEETPA